ncbi:MAG: hypothetical protein ABII01_00035 [Candidatus Woesearchaeota archaeon]
MNISHIESIKNSALKMKSINSLMEELKTVSPSSSQEADSLISKLRVGKQEILKLTFEIKKEIRELERKLA